MQLTLDAQVETWALARPFRIARGLRTHSDLIVVTLRDAEGRIGRGEGAPIARYGVTAADGAALVRGYRGAWTHDAIRAGLPAGAARNALDNALWDLEAQQAGRSVDALLDRPLPAVIRTAETLSIDQPDAMAAAARRLDGPGRVIKVKLDREQIAARMTAIRAAAPQARLIVDANEGWTLADVLEQAELLLSLGVEMLEQPLPAGRDAELAAYRGPLALSADESCHTVADVAGLQPFYRILNIKLDKTGGLSEALALEAAAQAAGLETMVGCMISTSLSMAPAARLAARARFVDLDGPTWLADDRAGGFTFQAGEMTGGAACWGSGQQQTR